MDQDDLAPKKLWEKFWVFSEDWDENALFNLYNVQGSLLDKLRAKGFENLDNIINVDFNDFVLKTGLKSNTAKRIYLNAKAIKENRIFLLKPFEFDEKGVGYIDIELGGSKERESIIFLISFFHADQKNVKQFFAGDNTLKEEKRILIEFLKYIEKNKIKKLYCYSRKKFDFHWINDRIKAHNLDDDRRYNYGLKLLNEGYDIYWIIKAHVVSPTLSMKLKELGTAFGFVWRQYPKVDTHTIGGFYYDYTKTKNRLIKKMMFEYNEDDVLVIDHIISKMKEMDVSGLKAKHGREFEREAIISGEYDEDPIKTMRKILEEYAKKRRAEKGKGGKK